MEKEKVIRWLECCIKSERDCLCPENCPYADADETHDLCETQVKLAALALLKEQEPPTSDELKVHYGKMYKCKGCGLEWYQQAQRYCQHCGQAVKWE